VKNVLHFSGGITKPWYARSTNTLKSSLAKLTFSGTESCRTEVLFDNRNKDNPRTAFGCRGADIKLEAWTFYRSDPPELRDGRSAAVRGVMVSCVGPAIAMGFAFSFEVLMVVL
jgi:hypothetical protein